MWIHWEKGLVKKPEVIRIARALKCTPQHAAACCMQVWEWIEDNTTTGIIDGLAPADVSVVVGIQGIAEAMEDVGWMLREDNGIVIPNFDRHNGEPAKRRAEKARRMRVYRAEKRAQDLHEREKRTAKF